MGLLDDAIREHLELKRRTGAQPAEIARVEREALEPVGAELLAVFDGHMEMPVEDAAHADMPAEAPAQAEMPVEGPAHAELAPDWDFAPPADVAPAAPARELDMSTVGQETVELDMQAVLYEDAGLAEAPPQEHLFFE